MPAQVSLAVNDGKPTPLTHTFAPQGVKEVGGETVASFRNVAANAPLGMEETYQTYWRRNSDGSYAARLHLRIPKYFVDPVTGVATLKGTDTSTVTMKADKGSTQQERDDLWTMTYAAASNGGMIGVGFQNAEGIFAQ